MSDNNGFLGLGVAQWVTVIGILENSGEIVFGLSS